MVRRKTKSDRDEEVRDIAKEEAYSKKYQHESIFVHIKKRTLNCWLRAIFGIPFISWLWFSKVYMIFQSNGAGVPTHLAVGGVFEILVSIFISIGAILMFVSWNHDPFDNVIWDYI